ncbi:MAG: SUMF1/EgtB/PvdO family nonheme iron enzyme [Anaerolineae bacterium]|nr:SUMF1/EgtB/PvdO family nonheme iron enzyme [Anaerolineae bacterium]
MSTKQKDGKNAITVIALVVGGMGSVFTLLEALLPGGEVTPAIAAIVLGIVATGALIQAKVLTFQTAGLTVLGTGILLLIVHLIISQPATVSGYVIDSNGDPVVGKTLILTDSSGVDHRAITDAEGRFEIRSIPEGRFTIVADGYLLRTGEIPPGWRRFTFNVDLGGLPITLASTSNLPGPIDTPELTETPVPVDTSEPTGTPRPMDTDTLELTDAPTLVYTDTPEPTESPTPTDTSEPTDMPTSTNTNTPEPTDTPTSTNTNTPEPTDTPTSTETHTPTVIPAPTFIPANTNPQWTPVVREFKNIPFVYVPAGCFMMGSENGYEDERPVHRVCLSAFWIGQTEITNAQYRACAEAYECTIPKGTEYFDRNFSDYPITRITWEQASQFASWIGGNLPTEAQWEYAARGPAGWVYPWGNLFDFGSIRLNFCDVTCYIEDIRDETQNDGYQLKAPVGSYPRGASWVGALDMAGNVWEWIFDYYNTYSYELMNDGAINPVAADINVNGAHVVRGGGFMNNDYSTRSATRGFGSSSYEHVGFRITIPVSMMEWRISYD